jgi:hypothetical protein
MRNTVLAWIFVLWLAAMMTEAIRRFHGGAPEATYGLWIVVLVLSTWQWGRVYLLALRDLFGYWWVYPVHLWHATPAIYRIALNARRREAERCR